MKERAYEITINPKYNGYQRRLASMVYKFFHEQIEWRASVNEELAQESHKSVIEKFKKWKVYASFKIIFGQQI